MSLTPTWCVNLLKSGVKIAYNQTWYTSRTVTGHNRFIIPISAVHSRSFSAISSTLQYPQNPKRSCTRLVLTHPLQLNGGALGRRGVETLGGVRCSSSSSDDDTKTEVKGFFIQLPNPVDWVKDRVFTFFIRRFVDSSFNIDDFVFGAKQALSFLTRLMVMKDYETMKTIATAEVINKIKDLVSPMSDEQQQSIEILVSDISLASANVTSVSSLPDSYKVNVDLFCVALRTYKQRPLLVQMVLRFSRCYEAEKHSDWRIYRILEFNVREILKEERDRYQK